MTPRTSAVRLRASLLSLALVAACGSTTTDLDLGMPAQTGVAVDGAANHLIRVQANDSFAIQLGTVGPGEYQPPTALPSDAIQYAGMTYGTSYSPGGARQFFRFLALKPGTYVMTFPHVDAIESQPAQVVDTVVVR